MRKLVDCHTVTLALSGDFEPIIGHPMILKAAGVYVRIKFPDEGTAGTPQHLCCLFGRWR